MFKLEFPASEQVARAIWASAKASWSLCLGGKTWPAKEEQYERMKNPLPGDLVVEQGGGLRETNCAHAVGWLIKITREPVAWGDPDFEWDEEAEGRPAPTERVYYIAAMDGTEVRWVNAEFIAVPRYEGWWDYERWKDRDPLAIAMAPKAETA